MPRELVTFSGGPHDGMTAQVAAGVESVKLPNQAINFPYQGEWESCRMSRYVRSGRVNADGLPIYSFSKSS